MPHQHLFVIDPLASLNLKLDSSLRLMAALERLGDRIYVCEPRQLSWRKDAAAATACCQRIRFGVVAEHFQAEDQAPLGLEHFGAVHMRKDPPFDLDYITTTWLLDAAPPATKVYNSPEALRRFNEKLTIFQFRDEVRPGLVSADPEALLAFVEATDGAHGDAILKPLTLFGGRGVLRLSIDQTSPAALAGTRTTVLETLRNETGNGQHLRLIQAFDPAIFDGEVRVFTAFGEPIAWCLKKPETGNYLANTRAGAVLSAYTPSTVETERVRRVAVHLLKYGIVFIGFDLIGGFVSEVNVTSPRLLAGPGDQANYYDVIAGLIERDLSRHTTPA